MDVTITIRKPNSPHEAKRLFWPLSSALNIAHATMLRATLEATDQETRDARQRDLGSIFEAQAALVALELYVNATEAP